LLIGVASAPQAAASGFRSPYMIPDSASAALGILLAVTILATAGSMDRRDTDRESSCHGPGSHAVPGDAAGSSAAAPKSSRKP
jgi:hypothetical protein